ncbi:ATP-binding cassette domain-containing protein [Rhodocytophaga aerolata]|uniref:ATP-binding cassette domain-containing protein n=1 Tax=Rhodocytophaga aerolata TaxID=455078 RepID=A0ABT8RH65_9BACT|nr:ATP-binding cassette domain-containing protein [Rhodocytophaga aerolata]MDO1451445.1 ATP-binding cassette domain-containing protein [Rhodocytophaga aerolata]
MPEFILEADSIIYTIGTKSLLNDIYLKCQTGEVVGLLGSNGSGKSTLLKIIFGSLPTDHKHIRINGQVYNQPFTHDLIGYLSQDSFLPSNLSLTTIIDIFIPSTEKRSRVRDHQRIKLHLKKRVTQLSGGELRYFELLLLLNLNTPFVLLDEPFSGIEPIFKEQIKQLVKEYSREKGIIITDHDYRQIIEVSDRTILLINGACKPIKNVSELEDYNYIPSGKR